MTDSYGPWTIHTPGDCPVSPESRVQVQLREWTQIEAAAKLPKRADAWEWGDKDGLTIACYRVLLEPEWFEVSFCIGTGIYKAHVPVIDGKPDFSRQPEWGAA